MSITEHVDVNISLASAPVEAFAFGTPIGVFSHTVTANRQDGPYASIAEVEAAGFTTGAAAEVHAWASAQFAQEIKVDQLLIGRIDVGDSDLTDSLTQIEADDPGSFYILNCETRAEADILLAAAFAETRFMVYQAQSSDAALLAGSGGNIGEDLRTASYKRTALWYHRYDDSTGGSVTTDGYLEGAISSRCGGFDLDSSDGVGVWAYKELSGVTGDPLTTAQISNLDTENANFFRTVGGKTFTFPGKMAEGRFIDEQISLDWAKKRIEEEVLSEFVSASTKIPYTNAGIARVGSALQRVFDRGIQYGHFSPDTPPTMTLPDILSVSAADKAARQLTIPATATLSGGIIKAVFNITVQQ